MLRILDRIYLGAASAGSGGGSVDESKIIVKSATIPTAGEDYLGSVYMYVGETNSTYTHGYIYECKSSVSTTAIVSFEPHKIAFDEGNLVSFFEEAGDTSHEVVSGRFKYLEAGDIWNINGLDANGNTVFSDYQLYTQDLVDAGFVVIVPMTDIADGEEIAYDLVYRDTTSYAWERIDVQPGATRGRFLALWNCATGLAESNPPSSPYPYGAGDYYIVGTVGTTNYKPSGSSYVIGTASTTVETDDVAVNDTYYYDGTNWNLQKNTATTVDQTYDPTSPKAQSGVAIAGASFQTTTNLVTSVSSASTDTQYPSAKLFYDTCGDIETLINAL